MEELVRCLNQAFLSTLFHKLAPTFITATLAILGWLVIYNNAKKLASRNEAHALVQKIDDRLCLMDDLSRHYWSQFEINTNDITSAAKHYNMEIGGSVAQIRSYLQLIEGLSSMNLSFSSSKEVSLLRKACVLNSELITDMSQLEKDSRAAKSAASISLFRTSLYQSFKESY